MKLNWHERVLGVTFAERHDPMYRVYWRRIARGWRRFLLLFLGGDGDNA